MRIIDQQGNDLEESDIDLEHGMLMDCYWADPKAYETIDNETKFALDDDEFEWVKQYIPMTDEEIQNFNHANEVEQAKQDLPQTVADTDDAICALYEQLDESESTIASQDDAICELYEMLGGLENANQTD